MKKVLFVAMLFAGSMMAQTQKEYLIQLDTASTYKLGKKQFVEWSLGDTVGIIYTVSPTKILIQSLADDSLICTINESCDDGTHEAKNFILKPGIPFIGDYADCVIYLRNPSRFIGKNGYNLNPIGSFK